MTDLRRERGLWIARNLNVRATSGGWFVPSERGAGIYFVRKTRGGFRCDCEDWEIRQKDCKHVFAVLSYRVPKALFPEPPIRSRPTYRQEWNSYNSAQVNQKAMVQLFLSEICDLVVADPVEQRLGRPRVPL